MNPTLEHATRLNDDRVRTLVRVRLARCHAMRIGELSTLLKIPVGVLRAKLEAMRRSGEVERIRPVGYAGNDLDAYALVRPDGHPWDY